MGTSSLGAGAEHIPHCRGHTGITSAQELSATHPEPGCGAQAPSKSPPAAPTPLTQPQQRPPHPQTGSAGLAACPNPQKQGQQGHATQTCYCSSGRDAVPENTGAWLHSITALRCANPFRTKYCWLCKVILQYAKTLTCFERLRPKRSPSGPAAEGVQGEELQCRADPAMDPLGRAPCTPFWGQCQALSCARGDSPDRRAAGESAHRSGNRCVSTRPPPSNKEGF